MTKKEKEMLLSELKYISKGINPKTNKALLVEGIDKPLIINKINSTIEMLESMGIQSNYNVFYLEEKDHEEILSDDYITISKLVYSINILNEKNNINRIYATTVTAWLLKKGYLKESQAKIYKHPTDKLKLLDVKVEQKKNDKEEEYFVVEYSKGAQKFILDNINKIVCREY